MRLVFILLIAMLVPGWALGQASAIDSLAMFHEATAMNSGQIQQEMIYLHLDNNSYYRGDRIFFACYLVTSGKLRPSNLSQTVYVELLNPNGKVIDRCVLKSADGRCHGLLLADETPFYSGYYEIRAYTRYMLNFGPEAIFSRVIPIFASPKAAGDWSEQTITTHNLKNVPVSRPKTRKVENIELKFYPEGGHLVNGLPARVAFELTDAIHRPLPDVAGRIIDRSNDSVVAFFRSGYMGRGAVEFTPSAHRYAADLTISDKRYWCDLPAVETNGIALHVNNLPNSNRVEVKVGRSPGCTTKVVGVSLTCRGELYGRSIVDLSEELSATFEMSTTEMPTGVAQLTIFNAIGEPIADRLFFHNGYDFVNADYTFNKSQYRPYEQVKLNIMATDSKTGEPLAVPFSISVADADNHIAYGSDIMADLLLASEIKGYVHNPAYYFEEGKEAELDNLLMVQGWRRYSWRKLAGMEPIRIDSMPEQGIEVRGQVLERLRNRPRAGISVSAMLSPVDSTNIFGSKAKAYTFTTDENGRFILSDNIEGEYMMILSSANKNKVSNNRILLDLSELPAPRCYDVGELNVNTIEGTKQKVTEALDSAVFEPMKKRAKMLKEVEVTAKYTPAWWTAHYKENSIVSYDVLKEVNALRDNGEKFLRTLADLLPEIDNNFRRKKPDTLSYNGKGVLLIADPEFGNNGSVIDELMGAEDFVSTSNGAVGVCKTDPGAIPIDYIKNLYINTQQETLMTYAARMIEGTNKSKFEEMMNAYNKYGCVVFIEFYPDKRTQLKTGVRRDIIKGYTNNVEFYHPDYSVTPPFEPDYRRTLYWNPDLKTDENGVAHITFYNNGTARTFNVTATTLSPDGRTGALR